MQACDVCVGSVWSLHTASLTKESSLPVSDTPCFEKKKNAHTIFMFVTMKKTATQTFDTLKKKKSLVAECRATSSLSSGRRPPNE